MLGVGVSAIDAERAEEGVYATPEVFGEVGDVTIGS